MQRQVAHAALFTALALVVSSCGGDQSEPKLPTTTVRDLKPELVVQTGHTINVLDVVYSPKGGLSKGGVGDGEQGGLESGWPPFIEQGRRWGRGIGQ